MKCQIIEAVEKRKTSEETLLWSVKSHHLPFIITKVKWKVLGDKKKLFVCLFWLKGFCCFRPSSVETYILWAMLVHVWAWVFFESVFLKGDLRFSI
jgi:hypothetical protein